MSGLSKYIKTEILNGYELFTAWFSDLASRLTPELVNSTSSNFSIFGFSEFISALALLVIVYTVTDIRYKFRISVAPIPLLKITYYSTVAIGVTALLSDVWFAKNISYSHS